MQLPESIGKLIGGVVHDMKNGDYVGDDGLIYCGKCKTRREHELKLWEHASWHPDKDKLIKVGAMCKCAKEAKEGWEQEIRIEDFEKKIESYRQGMAKEIKNMIFDKDDNKHPNITKMMRHYVDNWELMKHGNIWLVLSGGVGTGKTFFAACIANSLINKGIRVNFSNFMAIERAMRSFDGKQDQVDILNDCELLIVDDMGAERTSDYMKEIVFNVINERILSGMPCIITTNLTKEKFLQEAQGANARIFDRIISKGRIIEFDGDSKRKREYLQNTQESIFNLKP